MEQSIIFIDIDETLYDNRHQKIYDSARAAIFKLSEAGHILCIATGRSAFEISSEIKALPFDYFILSNGQHIAKKDEGLDQIAIGTEILEKLIKRASELGIALGLAAAYEMSLVQVNERAVEAFEKFKAPLPKVDAELYKKMPILQAMILSEDFKGMDVEFESHLRFVRWSEYGAHILPVEASKANGIQRLLAMVPELPKHIVAFGDGYNDMEMLEMANIGVAMGNAPDALKNVADFVTTSIDENGIYHACEHLGLF